MKPDTPFKFGAWAPDQPDLNNPGLIEAKNVVWYGQSYRLYPPLLPGGSAVIGTTVLASLRISGNSGSAVFVGSTDASHSYLQCAAGAGGTWTNVTPSTPLSACASWSMTQYSGYAIAANGVDFPQYSFPAIFLLQFQKLTGAYGDAPIAKCCGVVGQFVVLGNIPAVSISAVRWSGIDAPLNWPTPNSADAIAQQSGQQVMDQRLGGVQGISEGDQWGVVLMDGGVVRMMYNGGQTVFGFDTIYRGPGPIGPSAWIKVGSLVYFASIAGVFVTDGTSVQSLGTGFIDNWFISNGDFAVGNSFNTGVDYPNKLIYWTFPMRGNGGVPNAWICFNYVDKRWTHGIDSVACYVRGEEPYFPAFGLQGFSTGGKIGPFNGSPGVATLVTPEAEFIPGKRAIVTAVTPEIPGTTSVTVKIGSRAKQSDSVVFTPAVAPDSFTGDSNFFVDNRYHRAQIDITGAFTAAVGGTFEAQPSSEF